MKISKGGWSGVGIAAFAAILTGDNLLAFEVTLPAVNSGYYNLYGASSQSVGQKGNITLLGVHPTNGKMLYHNWLAFDLSIIDGTIVAATLEIYSVKGNASGQALIWRDVSTPFSQLGLAGTSPADKALGVQIFNDLGTGQIFATGTHAAAALNAFALNEDALASLNASEAYWAIGGETTATAVLTNPYNYAFGLTYGVDTEPDYTMQLRLEIEQPRLAARLANVPEAGSSIAMLGLGLLGLFARANRLRSK